MTRERRRKFDLDLETLYEPDGRLVSRVAPVELAIPPSIQLRDDWLLWSWPLAEPRSTKPASMRSLVASLTVHDRVKARFDCLVEFAQLADAPGQNIVEFARRWGVLGLCRHGLPATHNPQLLPHSMPTAMTTGAQGRAGDAAPPGRADPTAGCTPLLTSADGSAGRETLAAWRFFATRARTILRVAARIRRGASRWEKADWDVLTGGMPFQLDRELQRSGWEYVALAVNGWLRAGNVRPSLVPSDKKGQRPRITISPEWSFLMRQFPLFGELGLQLMFATSTERGLEFCSSCGRPSPPRRQPAIGRRFFCRFCAGKAAARAASADYRARKRLSSAGTERRRTDGRVPVQAKT